MKLIISLIASLATASAFAADVPAATKSPATVVAPAAKASVPAAKEVAPAKTTKTATPEKKTKEATPAKSADPVKVTAPAVAAPAK